LTHRPWWVALALGLLAALGFGAYVGGWHLWAHYHYRAARRALAARDFAQARAHLTLCLDVWPDSTDTRLQAARAAWRGGADADAERHLACCERLAVAPAAVLLERALLRARRGELAGAEPYLLPRAAADQPDAPVVLEALIQGYLAKHRLLEALPLTERLARLDPDQAQVYAWRGQVWDRLHDYALAEENYRRAVELAPNRDDVRLSWAESLLDLGQSQEALEHLEGLHQRQPGNGTVVFALARCHHLLGNLGPAQRLLDQLLAVDPKDALALTERGRLALGAGQAAAAEGWLRQALALTPQSQDANYALFLCLEQQGKAEEAKTYRRRADRIAAAGQRLDGLIAKALRAPHDLALRCEMGSLFLEIGQDGEGLEWLSGVVRDAPRHPAAHRALADYYARAGKERLAAQHRQLAAQANPGARGASAPEPKQ
jgi:tetratricopeptide (TPR) repeat protein